MKKDIEILIKNKKKIYIYLLMRLESMRIGCLSVRTKNNFGINKMISEPRYKRRMETNRRVS